MVVHPPADAVDFVRQAFADANQSVAHRLCRLPNTWETALDQALIERLAANGGPVRVGSGWTIRIETHFLGGGRHFGTWEVADIGVLVMIRYGTKLHLTKVGLLQSKRLYPLEVPIDEAEVDHYVTGFARLLESEAEAAEASEPRLFEFQLKSSYKLLIAGDRQVDHIAQFEKHRKVPVHYLLYNPADLPWSQTHPLQVATPVPPRNRVGCRVVDAVTLRGYLTKMRAGESPTVAELRSELPSPYRGSRTYGGRRLEEFIARLVTCKEGYRAEGRNDTALQTVFFGRTGPIAAAIGITFEAPAEETAR